MKNGNLIYFFNLVALCRKSLADNSSVESQNITYEAWCRELVCIYIQSLYIYRNVSNNESHVFRPITKDLFDITGFQFKMHLSKISWDKTLMRWEKRLLLQVALYCKYRPKRQHSIINEKHSKCMYLTNWLSTYQTVSHNCTCSNVS